MNQPLHIAILTTARSDYWIWRPVIEELQRSSRLRVSLLVSGAHLSGSRYGCLDQIKHDGYFILEQVPFALSAGDELSAILTHGSATQGFARALDAHRPDLLFVLGDRLETHAAVCAATPLRIPVAHLHGGELTYGAIDDAFRHSITKLSHLHFVSTESYGVRVRQMGEPADRVVVCGAPALDSLANHANAPDIEALQESIGLPLDLPFILIAFHPVTCEEDGGEGACRQMLTALREHAGAYVVTGANIDSGGNAINNLLRAFCGEDPALRRFRENLGQHLWFAAMRRALCLVGNSSSGILEAASFGLPVIDIGDRQKGRITAANVLHSVAEAGSIREALRSVATERFQETARHLINPYAKGGAAALIRAKLESISNPGALLHKTFVDL